MKHRLGWFFGLGLTSILLLVAATPAGAAGTSQIDGVQTLVTLNDPFDPADDVFWMDGYGGGRPALIGYWYIRSFVLGVFTPSGVITGTGTEEFVGCYDANGDRQCGTAEPSGSLRLSYQAMVKVDPPFPALSSRRAGKPVCATPATRDQAPTTITASTGVATLPPVSCLACARVRARGSGGRSRRGSLELDFMLKPGDIATHIHPRQAAAVPAIGHFVAELSVLGRPVCCDGQPSDGPR